MKHRVYAYALGRRGRRVDARAEAAPLRVLAEEVEVVRRAHDAAQRARRRAAERRLALVAECARPPRPVPAPVLVAG